MKKKAAEKQEKIEKKGLKVKTKVQAGPHYTSFYNKRYNMYKVGDY